jgi:hypothetical protein
LRSARNLDFELAGASSGPAKCVYDGVLADLEILLGEISDLNDQLTNLEGELTELIQFATASKSTTPAGQPLMPELKPNETNRMI